MSLRDESGTITNTEHITFNPYLLWGMQNIILWTWDFNSKWKVFYVFLFMHYTKCVEWWWTIRKEETCCTIKHILNSVDSYYMITKISISFYLYRDNEDDVN